MVQRKYLMSDIQKKVTGGYAENTTQKCEKKTTASLNQEKNISIGHWVS